ncbi:hypothetical protein ACFSQ3_15495 [Sphingobacterium corticis]|uniref:DUF1570 domain-containing protein n=1 Tax=Sphingobacterium corticis TaxID=1812823 RepID=A0ABW5NNZ1_9SPHI
MKAHFLIFGFLLVNSWSFGQKFTTNFNIDLKNEEMKSIVKLWQTYLTDHSDEHWVDSERERLNQVNILDVPGIINPSLIKYGLNNHLTSISKLDDDYLIRSTFQLADGNVFASTYVLAKKQNDQFKLSNFLYHSTKDWTKAKSKLIDYYATPDFSFNPQNIQKAEDFYEKLCASFNLEPERLSYFITKDCDDIYKSLGYDYIFLEGMSDECGYYVAENNFIFSTIKGGENHYHELTHVVNKKFPKAHPLLLAGLSAYLGKEKAHLGKPLIYHIKRTQNYLKENPEFDLSNFTDFKNLDSQTNPQYVIGAILCDLILEKTSKQGLISLLQDSQSDELLYDRITSALDINKDQLNDFLRNRISKLSTAQDSPNRLFAD